jgi:hypothetical protein
VPGNSAFPRRASLRLLYPDSGGYNNLHFQPPSSSQARRVRTRKPFHGLLDDPDLPPLRLELNLTEVNLTSKSPWFFTWLKPMFEIFGATFGHPPKAGELTNVGVSRSLTRPTRCGPDLFQTFCQALRKRKGLRPLFLNNRLAVLFPGVEANFQMEMA